METHVDIRVRYGETDQMGVAYHANYLAWCDVARTEYLRERGMSYRALEEGGLFLAVIEAAVRYRGAARFDDRLTVRCWVRECATRKVEFGYVIETAAGKKLATARTALIALDSNYALTQIPASVRPALTPVADPVRL